jgi:hypothetical protein
MSCRSFSGRNFWSGWQTNIAFSSHHLRDPLLQIV